MYLFNREDKCPVQLPLSHQLTVCALTGLECVTKLLKTKLILKRSCNANKG